MNELVIFVLRGKVRKAIILNLIKPKNANQLAKDINTHLPTISRALKDLIKKDLVKCLNPNYVGFKLYELTDFGKFILEEVKKY
jgi:predicted transcriptional regulator